MDLQRNFAYSTVATAPSPATTGTSLTVQAGQGALFPAPPFNAVVWPIGTRPLTTNAEVVRVTAVSGDTFTIVRQTATETVNQSRAIGVGDQVMESVTGKSLTDIGLMAQLSNLTIVGHSWSDGGGVPTQATSRLTSSSQLMAMLGVHEDNCVHLAMGGSLLTFPHGSASATEPFGGWGGVLQLVVPDGSNTVAGPSTGNNAPTSLWSTTNIGQVANGPAYIMHGVNDPAQDPTSWPTQGLTAWSNALTACISRLRAGIVYGSYIAAGGTTFSWDSSIVFGGSGGSHWSNVAQILGNTGPGLSVSTTTADTVTITLPTNLPASGTVAVCFIGTQTGYATVATLGALSGTGTGTFTVGSSSEFPSGAITVKIDNEEMSGSFSGATFTITARGVNGTTAATHSGTPAVISAPDVSSVAFTGTAANSTGTLQLAGQGYAGNQISIVKRIAFTSADAGKTIIATATLFSANANERVQFDSWWIEANVPPPVVVANMPRAILSPVGGNTFGFTTWNNLNTKTNSVVAGFDSAVQVADLDAAVYDRSAETTGSIAASGALSIPITANGLTFPTNASGSFRISVFNPADGATSIEDMLVTGVSGTYPNLTLTVLSGNRGYNGTTAQAHSSGADVTDRYWWYTDNLHPNAYGHSIWALALFNGFANAMTQTSLSQPYQSASAGFTASQKNNAPTLNLIDNFFLYPSAAIVGTPGAQVPLNDLTAFPVYIPQMCIVTEFDINVFTLGTGSTVRAGIYLPSTTGQPQYLLADFGSVATTSTGIKTQTGLYQVLRPGWYWVAYLATGTTAPFVAAVNNTGGGPPIMQSTVQTTIGGYFTAGNTSTTALPTTFTANGVLQGDPTPGMVYLRLRSKGWS